ncbi:MAG: biotin--[acetyl-CoA-carboxylase] ligase, partial [Pseudomonadota bacterium]
HARRTVFVSLPEGASFEDVGASVRLLGEKGHHPVPHVPASAFSSEAEAERVFKFLADDCGAKEALVVDDDSFLLKKPFSPLTPERAALSTFATSLAVADTVSAFLPDGAARVTLKWPNDVLVGGRKVAGILLESSAGQGGKVAWLVIGMGLNLAAAPPAGEIRPGGAAPTSLAAEGAKPASPAEALAVLGAALPRWLTSLEAEGFEAVRAPWLARAGHLGQTIGAGLARERLEGVFEDVDETGALVLRTREGAVRHISAADIYFPD